MLEPLGFEVKEATNGQEAIDIWEEWEPHLIWMDMRMPVIDGHEATKRIKGTTQGQATVIVALTASGLEEERTMILSEGCDDYLRKPFYEEDLYNALSEHLGVRFLYDDSRVEPDVGDDGRKDANGEGATQIPSEAELISRMSAVTPSLLVNLEQATALGDVWRIEEAISAIDESDSLLATELANMAHEFEHEQILGLIHKADGEGYGE